MKDIDWKILQVLYEKKSITKAAGALYMTQPALTKRLRQIEREWNVEIVKRNSRGVEFTEDGRYLVERSNIMLDFLSEIEEHFSEKRLTKEVLRLGVPNSFAKLHMPQLLKAYTEQENQMQIKTVSNSSDMLMKAVIDGSLDMGIICGDFPYLGERICLFEEDLFVVTPKGVNLDDIEHIPLIRSFFNPMVKLLIDQWWKNHFGSMPHETHYVPHFDIAIEMAANGLGCTFVFGDGWRIDEEKLQLLPVYDKKGIPVQRKIWLYIAEQCHKSQNCMEFANFVRKFYHKA